MGEIATNSYRRKLNILIYKRTERYKKKLSKRRERVKSRYKEGERKREKEGDIYIYIYIYIYKERENEAKKRMIHKYTDG